jgi:capsular exopolysaccharide synthesis family protein
MSRIFDALQRSEAERSGVDVSVLSDPTELLQQAERQAASKWDSSIRSEQPSANENAETYALSELDVKTASQMVQETLRAPDLSAATKSSEVFDLFQSLQVSLTPQSRLVCLSDPEGAAAEAFRLLGVRLRHLRRDRTLKRVLITSTIPQEGKSMVAANLACTLAQATQKRTLLLEGDLRRPSLSQRFGIGRNPGICELLQGERSLVTSIYHLKGTDLWILPAGSAPSNALELLQSGKLSALMDQLNAWFDWIVIDSPPILPLADTSVWGRLADGILLVARLGTTEKKQLQRGLEALEPKKVLGALVNCSTTAAHSDYYYRPSTVATASELVEK